MKHRLYLNISTHIQVMNGLGNAKKSLGSETKVTYHYKLQSGQIIEFKSSEMNIIYQIQNSKRNDNNQHYKILH